MHPTIQRQLINARIADLYRQAERGRIARAARSARHRQQAPHQYPADRPPGFPNARRVIAVLTAWPAARRPAI
jgi:hypothetical protein